MELKPNEFLTPVGRLLQGSAMDPQTTDMKGQPLVYKTGANKGQPRVSYFMAIGFPKVMADGVTPNHEFNALYGRMLAVARAAFPQYFDASGNLTNPNFSMKLVDGDGRDSEGKPNDTKEGFKGHWIIRVQSSYPFRCFYQGRHAPQDQITDKNLIRRGHYVRVFGTMEGNGVKSGGDGKPGLYMNASLVEYIAAGPEIVSGPDASQAFAAPVAVLPAGATAITPGGQPAAPALPGMPAAPVMPHAAVPGLPAAPVMPHAAVPGLPAAPMAPALPVQYAAPPMAVAPAAPLPVTPYPGVMQMPGVPMAPAAPAAPPAPPAPPMPDVPAGPVMSPKANGATYAQMIALGWTHETMVQHGMLVG